jgi:hypothetical protein
MLPVRFRAGRGGKPTFVLGTLGQPAAMLSTSECDCVVPV